ERVTFNQEIGKPGGSHANVSNILVVYVDECAVVRRQKVVHCKILRRRRAQQRELRKPGAFRRIKTTVEIASDRLEVLLVLVVEMRLIHARRPGRIALVAQIDTELNESVRFYKRPDSHEAVVGRADF